MVVGMSGSNLVGHLVVEIQVVAQVIAKFFQGITVATAAANMAVTSAPSLKSIPKQ